MNSIFDSAEFNNNLFFPRPDQKATPAHAEDHFIEVETPIKIHVRRYTNPAASFTLLYFHGNGEIASDYDDLSGILSDLGAELVAAEYRGYGKSDGTPTLRRALDDARRIYDELKAKGILKKSVCVMGRSLGSASAIELCSQYPEIACCVIESGYADPIPLVERRGLKVDAISPEDNATFNNSQKISKVSCPTLIMHGEDDFLISPAEAQLNHKNAGAKNKALEILEGVGHNDMMMAQDGKYFLVLKNFWNSVFVG
ncbi:MAG: alpha/beta hydrolase [Candidatus Nitrohelix vancouverensis]|uniref:Alpha/beta hydrolase n=1 Tax=Candidatus Nitrohelix vancouverensis TaxID=2705534 RepID=A0A7T0C3M8_9BACT|nr:MAG: alpha/beta hydrolase [Candidatus Nitrohelix vancouverensis]